MGLPAVLVSFGVGLIGAGIFWQLFEDILTSYFAPYMLRSPYFRLANMEWHMIPIVIIIMGVISLISSAIVARQTRTVIKE